MTRTPVTLALVLALAGAAAAAATNRFPADLRGTPTTVMEASTDCAGEWTRAVATINDASHNNTMVIRNAINLDDAVRRARQCRGDATNVTYFNEGARLACAPYIACG